MSAALQVVGPTEPLPAAHPVLGPVTPLDLVNQALATGAGIETVRELLALRREHEADEARKAFDEAISAAKATIPTITKNKSVGFDSRKQGAARTEYRHETLDEIARVVNPILAQHGLSYRYRVASEPNQPIVVTCIVSHRRGHSEETTLTAGRDDSGNKNAIQQIGSTLSYLQRYTLKAALGLAAAEDDDGRTSEPADRPLISEDQAMELRHMIGSAEAEKRLLDMIGVPTLEEIFADRFADVVGLVRQKAARR